MDLSKQLLEAAANVLTEEKKPLFNVGDEVALANHYGYSTRYHSPGVVVKTNKHGHTIVDHGHKNINGEPDHVKYDHRGSKLNSNYSHDSLISKAEYDKGVARTNEKHERNRELSSVAELINSHRNGFGDHGKISKEHAKMIHDIITKHTQTED